MPTTRTTKLAKPLAKARTSPAKRAAAAKAATAETRSNTRIMLDEIHVRGEELSAKISDLLRRLS